MRIGLMGGTFDPIHIGHLIAAERAAEHAALQEIWFLPALDPPHKSRQPGASGAHRLEMVRLAVADRPGFEARDFELRRPTVSYTIDTVKQLMELYPEHRFFFIIGGDMVDYLPKWHRIDELCALIEFIGLDRPGSSTDLDALPEPIRRSVTLGAMPLLDISSTDIRERLGTGRSVRYLLPEQVRIYAEEHRLYDRAEA